MYKEEKTFNLRFSLEAQFPDHYEGNDDEMMWVREWEVQMKPQVIKEVFESLRKNLFWNAHVRNRGVSPEDEIEISIERTFS